MYVDLIGRSIYRCKDGATRFVCARIDRATSYTRFQPITGFSGGVYYKSGAVDARQYHRIGNAAAIAGQRGRVAHTSTRR